MAKERAQRRLAAILAADVVGYSRLMEQDEAGTLEALADRRKAVLEPLFAKYHGRVVRLMGDGTLAEFASAVDAVQCAVDIQRAMKEANAKQSNDRAIVLRVGLNLGDVVVEDGDLYGDGVNIAARLEAMADPGGICLSAAIHQQVERLLPFEFTDLGDQALKNIARPVRVYCVAEDDGAEGALRAGTPTGRTFSVQSKPAIAVLPFSNRSADPEQQYFSDGIAEDIITELSRYRSLLVIARNSCFQFRGPAVDIGAVRQKLGVRYVVEGSAQRVGTHLHLTARLIDALNESHVWAERYDRDVEDIFAIQDDMARAIAAILEGRVAASGAEQARRRPTKDWKAYDYFLQGRELWNRYDFIGSEPYFTRAIELDPSFAQAHALRTNALIAKYWNDRRVAYLDEALQSARTALSLDDADALCHSHVGFALSHRGQLDLAGPHFERAVALNPTDVQIAMMRAWWLARVGRADEAIEVLDNAMRRDPFPPQWAWEMRAIALMQARRYEDAVHAINRMSEFRVWDHAYLAACYARLNRDAEARAAAADVLRMDPSFTVSRYGQIENFKDPADLKHLLDGMRKAGLPD